MELVRNGHIGARLELQGRHRLEEELENDEERTITHDRGRLQMMKCGLTIAIIVFVVFVVVHQSKLIIRDEDRH
jgi:hypothetical protein